MFQVSALSSDTIIQNYTDEYLPVDETYINSGAFYSTYYQQNWQVDRDKVVPEGLEKHFYFRYLNDIYVYAFYEQKGYTINYYYTDNNSVYLNDAKYADGVEFSNNVDYYNSANAKYMKDEDIKFNSFYTTKIVQLNGYDFIGWYVTEKPLTADQQITVTEYSNLYLNQYIDYTKTDANGQVGVRVSDETIGDERYKQNWLPENEFIFRYTPVSDNLYCYAYYVPKVYTIRFYYSNYNYNSAYHGTSHIDNVSNNYDEYYNVNTNYVEYINVEVTFNKALRLPYSTFNLNGVANDHLYVPYGYDFYYYIFSRSTPEQLFNYAIYDDGNKNFYSSETNQNDGTLISKTPSIYVKGEFAASNNYIFEAYYNTLPSYDETESEVVKYWDLYDQNEYHFYAYYRKEIYSYYYYNTLETTPENVNKFSTYQESF